LAAVLKGVAELDFGDFEGSHIDLFGDAYEFLISNYAANAGKSGGEFFTPQHVSKLIAQLAMHKQTSVNKIYDPACGSGSLLLQAKKHFDAHIIEDGFFGQEINHTTYNLARMNMFLHNINYDKFNIQLGNTLTDPHFGDDKPFDAIVSNPPYSVNWIGSRRPHPDQRRPLCPGRRAGAQIQGRLCLCAARAQLPLQQRPCGHRLLPRHFLPGRCRAENPPISGG
jgi:type I restriction enzyme M protein